MSMLDKYYQNLRAAFFFTFYDFILKNDFGENLNRSGDTFKVLSYLTIFGLIGWSLQIVAWRDLIASLAEDRVNLRARRYHRVM